jgi:hypothetical protein
MSKIIGIITTSFKGKEGNTIEGKTIHITDPIAPKRGEGVSSDKFFLTTAKLKGLDFTPAVGQEIKIYFNRFGKPDSLELKEEVDFG